MTMNNSSSEGPGTAAVGKKPYEKPSFRYEEVFVTSALSCTKTPGNGLCDHTTTPRSS
jgi:hypothetical protein